jgi:hypothetical protein
MDAQDAITVVPTEDFFSADNVMVRAWKGYTQGGTEVIALIAGVSSKEPLTRLTPIPPPRPEWSERVVAAMGRLWKVTGELEPDEAEAIAGIAETLTAFADRRKRRELAQSFCADMRRWIEAAQ